MSDNPDLTLVEAVKAILSEVPGGSILTFVIDQSQRVQLLQAEQTVNRILDLLAGDELDLVAKIQADQRLFRLVADTLHAAARADSDAKLEALARVAAGGLQDTALLDEARYKVNVLSQMDVIHVRLLVELEELPEKGAADVATLVGVSPGVAVGLAAHMMQLGVAKTSGMSFTGQHASILISDFGLELLRDLRSEPDRDGE